MVLPEQKQFVDLFVFFILNLGAGCGVRVGGQRGNIGTIIIEKQYKNCS